MSLREAVRPARPIADSRLLLRALLVASIVERIVFVVRPLDVLWPVNAHHIGQLLLHGHLPYSGFAFEYPPLSAVAFFLPGLAPSWLAHSVLSLEAVACELAVLVLVLRPAGPDAVRRYAVLSLFMFPFLSGGFDALPMAAIAISTALLARGRSSGWWVAAAGALVKLSPGVAWFWAGRTARRSAVVALIVTGVVALAPLVMTSTIDRTYLGYHAHRGVEVESLPASTAWVGHVVSGRSTDIAYRFRSWQMEGAGWAVPVWVVVAAIGLLLVATRSRGAEPWAAACTCVLVVMVGNKVLSPQFMAWPLPLVAVLGGHWYRRYLAVVVLTFVALALSTETTLLAVLAARNVVLVALAGAGVAEVVGRRRRQPLS